MNWPMMLLQIINLDSVPETIKQDPAMLKEYMDSLEMVEKIKIELSNLAAQQENFGIFTPGVIWRKSVFYIRK